MPKELRVPSLKSTYCLSRSPRAAGDLQAPFVNHVYSDLAAEKGIVLDLRPKEKEKPRAVPKAQKPARPLEDASFRHLCAIQELRREATRELKRMGSQSLACKG